MRRIVKGLAWILLLFLAILAAFLAEAHWEIRRITPELPSAAAIAAALDSPDGPVSLHYINTATQRGGPGPAPLGHSSFRLAWSDGRVFLIDAGMDADGARAFSKPIELLVGADPVETHGSVAEQLGASTDSVRGIAFTHLHSDHTQGLHALCAALGRDLDAFQTSWQAERGNYTTAPGKEDLATAGCVRTKALGAGPVYAFPGFPGLIAVAGGGHTPGSTIFFARVGDKFWIFSGDVTNFREELVENRPKAFAYSLLVTPEAPARLEALRRWLGSFDVRPGYRVLVSHDTDALAANGVPEWATSR